MVLNADHAGQGMLSNGAGRINWGTDKQMSSIDTPNPYNLLGENAPVWLVLGLLLIGTIGSVTTMGLLLPPGLNVESLRDWASQTRSDERASKTIPSVNDTTGVSADPPARSAITEPAGPSDGLSRSRQKSAAERHQDSSTPTAGAVDDTAAQQPSASDIAQSGAAAEQTPLTEASDDDRAASPSPTAVAAPGAESAVEFAANNAAGKAESIEPTTAQTDDCAPLFDVQFARGGIKPATSNLGEKAATLSAWLGRHPAAKLLVEGHADSSGPEELNLLLSHRRARAVFNLLAGAGVATTQMSTSAFGEYSPLEGLPSLASSNRRVSIRIEGAQRCPETTSDGEIR